VSHELGGRNLWGVTVLWLLWEGPLHPYEMLRLLRERRKDRVLDLRRGSIYNTIGQLERAGLIESAGTGRDGRRPERTVYRLTEAGREAAATTLREGLAVPVAQPSRFLAAVSALSRLTPEEVLRALRARAAALEVEIAGLSPGNLIERSRPLRELRPDVARVVLLDADYLRAIRRAELDWVRTVIEELERGRLSWKFEDFARKTRRSEETQSGVAEPGGRSST
jgi:DNA-binding PadR family transcriptional regulator